MKTTIELLQQLNTMQTNHIKLLNERIDNINEHRQHLNETISSQAEQLHTAYTRIELEKETKSIDDDTISKLFAAAKKDKEVVKEFKRLNRIDEEVISDFKKIINKQGKQIKELKGKVKVFANGCKSKDKTIRRLQNDLRSSY